MVLAVIAAPVLVNVVSAVRVMASKLIVEVDETEPPMFIVD